MIYKYIVEIGEVIGQEYCDNKYEGIVFAENFRRAAEDVLELFDGDGELFSFRLDVVNDGNIYEF